MNKIGFCFTGEGARGEVQAGIAYGLYQEGIKADFTIGISSGSICSASYSYLGPEGLLNLWNGISSVFDVFNINYNFIWKTGLMNQNPMEKIVFNAMKNDPICESVVVRMNVGNGYMDYFSNNNVSKEEFAEAILGAVAITGLVEDRNGWVDAGSRQIAPLEQCIQAGCNQIYVIMGRRFSIDSWNKPSGFFPISKMIYRALDISLNEIMIRDITNCLRKEGEFGYKGIDVFLVEPNETLYDSVEFSKCKLGTEYGTKEYHKLDKKALKNIL